MKGDRDEAQRVGEKSTCTCSLPTSIAQYIPNLDKASSGQHSRQVPVNKDGGKMNGDEKSITQRSRINNREERRRKRKEKKRQITCRPPYLCR